MSQTVLEPEVAGPGAGSGRWMVVIFNNEINSVEEVVQILMRATGCDFDEAYIEMWEAHSLGKAPVHFAARNECEETAAIISSIGLTTEVTPEWDE